MVPVSENFLRDTVEDTSRDFGKYDFNGQDKVVNLESQSNKQSNSANSNAQLHSSSLATDEMDIEVGNTLLSLQNNSVNGLK